MQARPELKRVFLHDRHRERWFFHQTPPTYTFHILRPVLMYRVNISILIFTDTHRHFKFSADHRKLPSRLTFSLRAIRPLLILLVPRWPFEIAVRPPSRTVCKGYRDPPSRMEHISSSCSKVLPTNLQAHYEMPQPSVKNRLTSSRGATLRVLLESPSHSLVVRIIPLHP